MKRVKWYHIIMYFCFLFSIIIIGYTAIFYKSNSVKFKDTCKEYLNKGWKYVNNDGKEESIKAPSKLDIKKGETTVIVRKIPDKNIEDMAVLFGTYHTFVKAYADNELIYSYGDKKQIPFGKSPGSLWNLVNIPKKYKGKELRIELTCPYAKYSGNIPTFIYGSKGDLIVYALKDSLPLMLFSMIPFAMGIIIMLFFFVLYKYWKSLKLFDLSLLLIISSLWGLSESRFYQFYFGDAVAAQVSTFLFLAMTLMSASILLNEVGVIKSMKKFKLCFVLNFIVYVIINILQLFNIVDYFNSLFLIHCSAILTCILILIDVYKNMIYHKNMSYSKYLLYGFCLIFLCGVLDTIEFYFYDVFGNGFFLRIGLLLFMSFLGIWYMKTYIHMAKENIEKSIYERLAYTDSLTLKKNRRAFNEDLLKLKEIREKGTIVFADINNLKVINDTFGHEEGDKAIIIVSRALEKVEALKLSVYRLGGDEFCIIASEKSINEVEEIIEDVVNATESLTKDKEFNISLAYGYAEYDTSNDDINDVVNKADKNMYMNKKRMKEKLL